MRTLKDASVQVPTVDNRFKLIEFAAALSDVGLEKLVPYVGLRIAHETKGRWDTLGDLTVYKRLRKGKTAYARWIEPMLDERPALAKVPEDNFVSYGGTHMLSLVWQRHLGDVHPSVLVDPRIHAAMVARAFNKALALDLSVETLFCDTWAVGSYKRMEGSYVVRRTERGVRTIADVRRDYWAQASDMPKALTAAGYTPPKIADVPLRELGAPVAKSWPVPDWARLPGSKTTEISVDGQEMNAEPVKADTLDVNEDKEEERGDTGQIQTLIHMWVVNTGRGERDLVKMVRL